MAVLGPGQRGDQLLPPGLAVLVRAEDAALGGVGGVDARGPVAAVERARLLVARHVAALGVGAVGADVFLHEILARVLVHADAVAVEPILAAVAGDHEAVVVGAAAETVATAVRVAAGPPVGSGGPVGVAALPTIADSAGARCCLLPWPTPATAAPPAAAGAGASASLRRLHARSSAPFLLGPRLACRAGETVLGLLLPLGNG